MSESAQNPGPDDNFEASLTRAARTLTYPPSPDVSRAVIRRLAARRPGHARRGWVLVGVTLALILVVILAVPPVRAAVLEWIRLGAVRIFLAEPSPTLNPTSAPQSTLPAVLSTPNPRTTPADKAPTDEPVPTPLQSVLDLSGETSLEKIQAKHLGFKVTLPAFPPGLGLPEHVYYQQEGWPVVVLVWMDPAHPQAVRLVLSETNADSIIFQKMAVESVQNSLVNGLPALWVKGPYMLLTGSGDMAQARLVENSHTLIWTIGELTYRLETSDDLETAVKIAESIK
jgi:hypothetical protein